MKANIWISLDMYKRKLSLITYGVVQCNQFFYGYSEYNRYFLNKYD